MTGERLLLYLPVLHAGYDALLERFADTHEILVLGRGFAEHHRVVAKEIRALAPERAVAAVRALHPGARVRVVEHDELPALLTGPVVAPDEDLMREVVAAAGVDPAGVTWEPTFLRWDRSWSRTGRPARFDGTVTADELHRDVMRRAVAVSGHSSDWWRQVGAVAVRDGVVVGQAHNRHRPTDYSPYLDGDPRNEFRRGVETELTTALHAEAALVARAAREGIALAGAELYVSTFPCPTCARLVAEVGFARCYFAGPYSMLAGDEVLRRAGVELVFVDLE